MGTISKQLQQFIRDCHTSRYELARAAGVSESALSRFMAGKSDLALEAIDRLAEVLGLELVQTIQSVSRPKPKGRRPKKKGSAMTTLAKKLEPYIARHAAAQRCAQIAHEEEFASRRGLYQLEDNTGDMGQDVLVYYNNNPYAADSTLRDDETKRIRKRLKALGVKEVGFATFPTTGKEAGYSFAMLIDLGVPISQEAKWQRLEDKVRDAIQAEVSESTGRLK